MKDLNYTLGSWMKAPLRLFGGCWPVAAYLRHSMMVCKRLIMMFVRNRKDYIPSFQSH